MQAKTKFGNRPGLKFAALFAILFLAGIAILLTPQAQTADTRLSKGLVRVSHSLIVLFGGKAVAHDAILRTAAGGFAVEMRDGCNAVNVTLLLWSAVLAFPARAKHKLIGLIAGTLVIQAVNIVRFISLFYIGQYSMTLFDFAHGYLWETLLILDTVVVFCVWVRKAGANA